MAVVGAVVSLCYSIEKLQPIQEDVNIKVPWLSISIVMMMHSAPKREMISKRAG